MSDTVPEKEEGQLSPTRELPPRSPTRRHPHSHGFSSSSSSQAGLSAGRSKRSSAHSSRTEVQRPSSSRAHGAHQSQHAHSSTHNTPRSSRNSNHLSPTGWHSGGSTKAAARMLQDKYLIGQELGRGAYGQVYKAIDQQNGQVVAIKQVSLERIGEDAVGSLLLEIDLLKNLNHRNIVTYLGSYRTPTALCIILEYVAALEPRRFVSRILWLRCQ
jgi:hypothetical protein